MKRIQLYIAGFLFTQLLAAQEQNCFLDDWQPLETETPAYVLTEKVKGDYTVQVRVNPFDTIHKISKYTRGNAVATWTGNIGTNTTVVNQTNQLSPSLIRYPGGSWSDIFFWNACTKEDVIGYPDSLVNSDGTKSKFEGQFGKDCNGNWRMNVDNYYSMRASTNTQGLITINYAYARYGRSENPVATAAKLAADWVRYDNGRTKFWEIGNETAGPWEAGWRIDTSKNQDGQAQIVSGGLYGEHFLVFADSMRKAAAEVGADISIGAQILHYDGTTSWNSVDRKWNEEVFETIGDTADFYVVHNYFGSNTSTANTLLNTAITTITEMMDFMQTDMQEKSAAVKPIALTEWNINAEKERRVSSINGIQSVLVFNELNRNNYGMSCRWLLVNWDDDGMYYKGNSATIPTYSPRPDFFYDYYLNKFTGDHMVNSESEKADIVSYAYSFSSGQLALMIVNKGNSEELVRVLPDDFGVNDMYYVYSVKGEMQNGDLADFPSAVSVNEQMPSAGYWGPLPGIDAVKAQAYETGNEILINSPAKSVQYILLEPGSVYLTAINELHQRNTCIFPNPSNGKVYIRISEHAERFEIRDMNGRLIYADNDVKVLPETNISLDLGPGIYVVSFFSGSAVKSEKLIVR